MQRKHGLFLITQLSEFTLIMSRKIKSNYYPILFFIILLGFVLRIIGFNWDQGQHLHPDERFLTMVLTDIKIPQSIIQYLNPEESTLNPYNNNYPFFTLAY